MLSRAKRESRHAGRLIHPVRVKHGTICLARSFSQSQFGQRSIMMKTLADIFEHTLQDMYYAENAITKALPKVAGAAKDAKLKKAAEDHLEETKGQIRKLEQVFKSIGRKASGEKCDAIEGLIKEANGLMEEASGTALDS